MRELWQWEQETLRPELFIGATGLENAAADRGELQRVHRAARQRNVLASAASLPALLERPVRLAWIVGLVVILAAGMVFDPGVGALTVGERLQALERLLVAREGELRHVRIEADRYQLILTQSARYGIPGDLAASIHDIAVEEDIQPTLAFALVRVESGRYNARSR